MTRAPAHPAREAASAAAGARGESSAADDGRARRAIEGAIGHVFADPGLLDAALTHVSAARERDGGRGNERLEFLGDAVLDLVVSRALFEVHPDWEEGRLSRTRAALVRADTLAERARGLGLGAHVRLGRTEVQSAGHEKRSILANVFEAVLAAVFLDGGMEAVEAVARRVLPEAFDPGAPPPERDPKTRLNEWAHAEAGAPPRYSRAVDRGEERGEARFEVEALVAGEPVGRGVGRTRRGAERAAARAALAALGVPPGARDGDG